MKKQEIHNVVQPTVNPQEESKSTCNIRAKV